MPDLHSLHLTNAWHGTSGGIRTFYEAMLAGADRRRRPLTLVVPAQETRLERRSSFTRIFHVRAPYSPAFDRRYRVMTPTTYASTRSAISRILTATRPDVVAIADKYALPGLNALIRWRAGDRSRPTLIGLSCERMDDNVHAWLGGGRLSLAAARAYLRHVYLPLFDAHIANSEYTADELRALIAPHRARQHQPATVRVGPMGVDIDGFAPTRRSSGIRQQLLEGAPPNTTLLAFAGRLSPEKHVMLLPEVLTLLAEQGVSARLVVCGDGPLRGTFERTVARLAPGRARVLGHLPQAALATLLASADAFVHPNPREPFGIGPLEAMASGTPVVLPRSGGVLMYANDANSWLTPPTARGLADGVRDSVAQPALTAARRDQALLDVQRWTWPAATDHYFQLYDTLDDARRSGAALATPCVAAAHSR